MKKVFFCLAAALVSLFAMSCDVGLGSEVDLTAPELKVEKPSNNAFVPREFNIEGTATDNIAVTSVHFEYSYRKDGQTITGTKDCTVSEGRFSCPFTFNEDIEVTFQITAKDKNENSSETSSDTRTVIIDSNNPKVGKIAVVRGGYIARLLSLDDFKKVGGKEELKDSPENKDYFQNQNFTLTSTLKDSYGIGEVTLNVYEDNSLVISKNMPENTVNKFSPEFSFTHDELIAAKPSLASGLHYLQPELVAYDTAGNEARDLKEFFAWYPEYDTPHVKYTTMQEDPDNPEGDQSLTVVVGEAIPITVFDDDGIKSVAYECVKTSESDSLENIELTHVESIAEGLRDYSFDIKAPDIDGSYKLIVKVDDTNVSPATYHKAIDLKVTNGNGATIIIETPKENSVPDLNGDKFTISGYTIDNQSIEKMAVAWLPSGNSDIAMAESFFEKYDFASDATTDGTTSEQIKIRKLKLGDGKASGVNIKNTFAVAYDFLEDFKKGGAISNETKVFVFACKDQTDNITTKTFRLNRFTTTPSFKVEYSYDRNTWKLNANPLVMCTPTTTYFKITPEAKNNMPIETCTVKVTPSYPQTSYVKGSHEYVEFTIDTPASGMQLQMVLKATDKLGGQTTNNVTIAFEDIGELQSIEANYAEESILKANDTLVLQANFSNRVSIETNDSTKLPYIQLYGTNFKYKNGKPVSEADRRAYYTSGNESNTLYFEYKIPDGVELEATNLVIPIGTSAEPTINLNSNTYVDGVFTKDGAGSSFNSLRLSLDSVAPYIVSYTPTKNGVVESTVDASGVRSAKISLTFNEPVEIESGSLVLQRTAGWYIPPVISEDVFLKLFNSDAAIKNTALRTALCGSTTNVRTDTSKDRLGIATMLPDGPYMQFTQGLDLSGTNAVPDISTKYVLKYGLNIADTTSNSTVSKTRNVLETIGYHKAEFDVQSMTQSADKKTLTLTVTDSDFIDCLKNGVEYSLTLTAESVRDSAYNYLAKSKTVDGKDYAIAPASGEEEAEYKLWVGPVAAPVIRVNRKATNAYNDAPTGKTDIMIDCETPGATIKWGSSRNESTGVRYAFVTSDFNNYTKTEIKSSTLPVLRTAVSEMASNIVIKISCSTSLGAVNGTIEVKNAVGDGSMDKASKNYIKALATKSDMVDSAAGYEGAFKTMVRYEQPKYYTVDWGSGGIGKNADKNTYMGNEFLVYGAQIPEGGSFTSGWPLTQNNHDYRHQYQIAYKETGSNYYWESWQILTDFTMQTNTGRGNFQQPANTDCNYGDYMYGYRVKY